VEIPFHFISIIIADSCITQVSRLIFNFLEANRTLDESIYACTMEDFTCFRQECNSDTDADTSLEAGRETFLGEKIYEEERRRIQYFVASIMLDTDGISFAASSVHLSPHSRMEGDEMKCITRCVV